MAEHVDPGYGDPLAPMGSTEWAKRWRLEFQNVVLRLPSAPASVRRFFEAGQQYRAWTLVTDEGGKPFSDFDSFCAYRKPYGLGMEPTKFRAYLEADMGKRMVDLVTVAPGSQGERTDTTTSSDDRTKSGHDKAAKLRAVLRAPEIVQSLYRDDLISQKTAAKMGPQKPTPDKAARIAEARQAIEKTPRPPKDSDAASKKNYRAGIDRIVAGALGIRTPTKMDQVKRLLKEMTAAERLHVAEWLDAGLPE